MSGPGPKPKLPAPPVQPAPHDKLFDALRLSIANGVEPAPADVTATGTPTRPATWGEVGKQAARGLAESGVGLLEFLTQGASAATGVPVPANLQEGFARTHQQLSDFYGVPKTDEEHLANFIGNLVGNAAVAGATEGITQTGAGIAAERRAAQSAYRLRPNPIFPGSFHIVDNTTGKVEGAISGSFDATKTYNVDMIAAPGANSLGTKSIRSLLEQLRDYYPDIKSVAGQRISGVRGATYSNVLRGKPLSLGNADLYGITRVPVAPNTGPTPTFRELGDWLKGLLGRGLRVDEVPPEEFALMRNLRAANPQLEDQADIAFSAINQRRRSLNNFLRRAVDDEAGFKLLPWRREPVPVEPLVGNDFLDIPTYQRNGGIPGEILDRPYRQAIQENRQFNRNFGTVADSVVGRLGHAAVPESVLQDMLDRAIFGHGSTNIGPLVNPASEILPAIEDLPLKGNRLLVTDEMAARAQHPGPQRILADQSRATNMKLRNDILANSNPLRVVEPPREGEQIQAKSIFDFLRGINRQ